MDSSKDIILYNPDNGEPFESNEERIKQAVAKINQILEENGEITDEEINKIINGET